MKAANSDFKVKLQSAFSNSLESTFMKSWMHSKVCFLLEWHFIISTDTCWDWCQRTYVLSTAQRTYNHIFL